MATFMPTDPLVTEEAQRNSARWLAADGYNAGTGELGGATGISTTPEGRLGLYLFIGNSGEGQYGRIIVDNLIANILAKFVKLAWPNPPPQEPGLSVSHAPFRWAISESMDSGKSTRDQERIVADGLYEPIIQITPRE
jgi:hypothetical protein